MYSYSLDGLDLAHAVRSEVLRLPQRGPFLSHVVESMSHLCEREAKAAAHGGKVDLEGELQSLLVATLRSDPLLYGQEGHCAACSRSGGITSQCPSCAGSGRVAWGIVAVHHSPMGGGRSEREGAMLKRVGARAGWPDLDLRLVDLRGVRRSVLLELKAGSRSKVSKEQKEAVKTLTGAGFEAGVVVGLGEMVEVVVRVLRGETLPL